MDTLSRRRVLQAAGLGAAGLAAGRLATAETLAAAPKPNILILVADDMGWGDVGYLLEVHPRLGRPPGRLEAHRPHVRPQGRTLQSRRRPQ